MDQGIAPPSADAGLRQELLDGLSRPQKRLPSKLFYDAEGSALFDAICELPEYYVTRTELAIMRRHAGAIAMALGQDRTLVEFGSGSSVKTRILLDHMRPAAYVPIDISGEHLQRTADDLRGRYPQLKVRPLTADFTAPLPPLAATDERPVVYFPGSTLGNFEQDEALALLRGIRATAGDDGGLLIGADLRKPLELLLPAYDDASGVTAAFNLNLLRRLNDEFGADFRIETFTHRVVWNQALSRIEMHLVAREDLVFSIFGRRFALRAGETLHTENSHKYSPEQLASMARRTGFRVARSWCDAQDWFTVQWWQSDPQAAALAA